MEWTSTISDQDELKVFNALDGPDITWRTVSAIARQTGLSEERVSSILTKYNSTWTVFANVPTISGSALVGLIENVGV